MSVFWVHASNAERFRESFTSIALECRVPGCDDAKTDALPLVKRWLERKGQGSWLMVLDNADDAHLFFPTSQESQMADSLGQNEYFEQYIPECAHGSILVTTRNKQAGSKLAKGQLPVEVGKMNNKGSDQLLRTKLEEGDLDSSNLSTLSSRLEHLPLALVQAAAFIQENTVAISNYLQLLDESDQNLVDLLSEEFETAGRDSKTPRALAETWILSFEQIQRQNPFSGRLLSLISFFDRQAIPEEFLAYYSQQNNEKSSVGIQLQKALGVLKAFSFVTIGKDQSLDMHRLVQLVMRKWLARHNAISHFAGQALLTVSYCFPFGDFENWTTCSQYLPHVYAVLKQEGVGSNEEKVAKAGLLYCAAGYFYYQGQWDDSERFAFEAVELRGDVLGADHPDTLASKGNLALTYQNQGQWEEAEKLEVQVIETSKTKLGADHPDTLASMANLASTYYYQDRWPEAEELQVKALEICTRVLGSRHPDTLVGMHNLAVIWRDSGRHGDALGMMQACLDLRQQILGAGHHYTLSTLSTLKTWQEEDMGATVISRFSC